MDSKQARAKNIKNGIHEEHLNSVPNFITSSHLGRSNVHNMPEEGYDKKVMKMYMNEKLVTEGIVKGIFDSPDLGAVDDVAVGAEDDKAYKKMVELNTFWKLIKKFG